MCQFVVDAGCAGGVLPPAILHVVFHGNDSRTGPFKLFLLNTENRGKA